MPPDSHDGAVTLTLNTALADELEALNSIYGPDTVVLDHATPTQAIAVLRLPDTPFSFLVAFPAEYPDVAPSITGTQSTGGSGRGEGEAAVNVLREVLERVWTGGQVCLFDLVEEGGPVVRERLREHHQQHQHQQQLLHDHSRRYGSAQNHGQDATNRSASASASASASTFTSTSTSTSSPTHPDAAHDLHEALPDMKNLKLSSSHSHSHSQSHGHGLGHRLTSDSGAATSSSLPPPAWVVSEPLTVNKSTFVARACPVSSLAEAMDSIAHLLATNKKVASATHNITAWRIRGRIANASANGNRNGNAKGGVNANAGSNKGVTAATTIQDCDDDGETAAGGRLLHLMQLMDVWNVLVVVTRWYGGVKLGPDRFRCINSVAREVLVKGGFAEEADKSKGKNKGKK